MSYALEAYSDFDLFGEVHDQLRAAAEFEEKEELMERTLIAIESDLDFLNSSSAPIESLWLRRSAIERIIRKARKVARRVNV